MGVRTFFKDALGLGAEPERNLAFSEWLNYFTFNGQQYPMTSYGNAQGLNESIGPGFTGYVEGAYRANGIVFTCMMVRSLLFSEARFQFRQFRDGRPGDLFGNDALIPLHEPWPSGTTGDLLAGMLTDADLAGNAFVLRQGKRLRRLRPDWVTIVWGSKREDSSMWDLDAELAGYLYQPGGPGSGTDPVLLQPNTVAHFAPIVDPLSPHRGMSWLTPVLREIMGDSAATTHKLNFYDKGATVNLAVEYDAATTIEVYNSLVDAFTAGHEGAQNAFKTLHLLGSHAVPIGSNFAEMDFKAIQGASETRIAAAAGIGAIIAQFSEGMAGSSLNAGNYAAARRRVADGTFRPLWRNAAASLAAIIDVPERAELWYDERDIAWLREDATDIAKTQETQAGTLKLLIDAGIEPQTAIDAVNADDFGKLKHSGLVSVQLQPPGTVAEPKPEPAAPPAPPVDPTSNGKKPVDTLTAPGG